MYFISIVSIEINLQRNVNNQCWLFLIIILSYSLFYFRQTPVLIITIHMSFNSDKSIIYIYF